MKDVHLFSRDASQPQHTAFQVHDLREDLIVGTLQSEDVVFELIDAFVEIIEHWRVKIDYLVQDLVQQESRSSLTRDGRSAQQLFHITDAAKLLVVISDDVIWSKKSIELDRGESFGTRIGGDTMDDEVDVTAKFFDLRIVPIFAAVFHRQRMKVEDVKQHSFVSRGWRLHVYPDDSGLVLQQPREILRREAFFDLLIAAAINKNLHSSSPHVHFPPFCGTFRLYLARL